MAWIEWLHRTLPSSDDKGNLRCSLPVQGALARSQSWSLNLHHFVRNPEIKVRGGMELSLSIEVGNLGFTVEDWRHIGRQEIIATPAWHARAETVGPYGSIEKTYLTVAKMEHDHASGGLSRREYRADHFRLTFSPPEGFLFPFELDAWVMEKEAFHTGVPLRGAEIHRIPREPPNLRVIGLALFSDGCITIGAGHPDPAATARQRIRQAIRLEEVAGMHVRWWADTERSANKQELPAPPGERRMSDVTFRT